MEQLYYKDSLKLKDLLENRNKILILTHVNPDGDAMGSSLALYGVLTLMGKSVNVVTPNDFPDFFKWMDGADKITVFFHHLEKVKQLAESADLILCLDFNGRKRMGKAESVIMQSDAFKVLVDHHPDPEDFASLVISDPGLGSTSELLYYLLKDMKYDQYITTEVAEALYTGIMTDTGNFSFACSYPEVWKVIGNLVEAGIDKDKIYSAVYDNYSESRMRLMGYCLYEKMRVFPELNLGLIGLTSKELYKFRHKPGDTEGFVNLPFSIKGVKITALFMEKSDHVRISLRSRGDFPVNEFSRIYFNGGGHKNAAGGELKMSVDDAIKKFVEVLTRYMEKFK